MYYPDFETFSRLASQGNLIPVYREIMADMDTPVSAFKKIDDGRFSFLLESIEGGEKWARYTFLGSNPAVVIRSKGNTSRFWATTARFAVNRLQIHSVS